MARRIAGTICLASALVMIFWLAFGATASGFVKFSLLGIVGSILVLYKWDDLVALLPPNGFTTTLEGPDSQEVDGRIDGVFGTELPPEAFAEPVPETKTVNLSSGSSMFKGSEQSEGSVLVIEAPKDTKDTEDADEDLAEPEATTEVAKPNSTAVVTSEPVFIQLADYSNDELVQSVRAGEASLVKVLTDTGMLSTDGPLTDTDVATMVFVAVSSDDLIRTLMQGKEAEEQAAALSYTADTPQLYEPAPQLVEPRS